MTFRWPRKGTTSAQTGMRQGFRSGLEDKTSQALSARGVPVLFETFRIPYAIPTKLHHYTPDFRLPNGIIVETKGRFLNQDRAKHLFVKIQYPWLDIRFVFSSSKAKTETGNRTYAQWCEENGFKFADKSIPVAWLAEPGPEVSIEDALAMGPVGFLDIVQARKAGPRGKKAA